MMKKFFRATLKRFIDCRAMDCRYPQDLCLIRISDRNHRFSKGGRIKKEYDFTTYCPHMGNYDICSDCFSADRCIGEVVDIG